MRDRFILLTADSFTNDDAVASIRRSVNKALNDGYVIGGTFTHNSVYLVPMSRVRHYYSQPMMLKEVDDE